MLTLSWRRFGSSSALMLALVVGLPALAQAQLFPNLYIQRQRSECVNEPPFYKHVRHDFYGYYPTCWRRFPEGWACPCPNPELPDRERSYREIPAQDKSKLQPNEDLDRNLPPEEGDMGTGDRPGTGAAGGAAGGAGRTGSDPALPALPNTTRSPFDTDPKGPSAPNGVDGNEPRPSPSAPGSTRPGTGPRSRPSGDAVPDPSLTDPTTNLPPSGGSPSLNGPENGRPKGVSSRSSSSNLESAIPVLALPTMSAPPTEMPVVSNLPASLPGNGPILDSEIPVATAPVMAAAPAQAPRRPRLIGSLFGLGNRAQR